MIFLEADEQVIATVRKHWLYLFKEIAALTGLLILPLILLILFEVFSFENLVQFEGRAEFLWIALTALWLLYCSTMIFMIWTDYYLDVLVITNKRIFDIEQRGLFFRDSSTFRLDRIQDITVNIKGLIATFMNFGDVHIQTAGDAREFIAEYIPDPFTVKRLIAEALDRAVEKSQPVRIQEEQAVPFQKPPPPTVE